MANLKTTDDLKKAALNRAGEVSDGNSDYDTQALEHMNAFYRTLFAGSIEFNVDYGEVFEWAKASAPGILKLVPPYIDGGISLTNDSINGTFSAAPTGLGSLVGHYLKVESEDTVYKIATHVADNAAFTLDQAYLEATLVEGAYKVYKLDYDLAPGIERLTDPMIVYKRQISEDNRGEISGVDERSLQRIAPLHKTIGRTPTRFAIVDEVDGQFTIRFDSYPAEDPLRVEYGYVPIPADLTTVPDIVPLVPTSFRKVLMYATAYYICLDKSDSRADLYLRLTQSTLQSMVAANRKTKRHVSKNKGRLIPRLDEGFFAGERHPRILD